MSEIRAYCTTCEEDFWVETRAEWQGVEAIGGWVERVDEVVCPECESEGEVDM